jgi:DNA-binding MarR family transcriptional regulator
MENGSDIDQLSEERRLWRLFGVTYYALFNTKKQAIERVGIQLVRGWVLWGLKAMDRPATITEMSQILNRDRQATAQLIKRMEDDGLVERHKGPSKGSAITVSLTPKGEALINRALDSDKANGEIMTCLTSDERENLAHYLHKLRREALARSASRSQCYPTPYASKIGLSEAEAMSSFPEGVNRERPGP